QKKLILIIFIDLECESPAKIAKPTEDIDLVGRRIVDIQHVFEQLLCVGRHEPFDCGLESMSVVKENRDGLHSTYTLKCKMCNCTKEIASNKSDINTCATAAALGTGIGYSQLEEFLISLDIPCFSNKLYQKCHEEV